MDVPPKNSYKNASYDQSMAKDIMEWARTCLACQRSKISRHIHSEVKLIPSARFRHVHIDIIGPMTTSEGYSCCLTIIDRYTRWPEAVPLKTTSTDEVINSFWSTWIARYGASRTITTHRGSQFESAMFDFFTKVLGCSRSHTTAYHSAANMGLSSTGTMRSRQL